MTKEEIITCASEIEGYIKQYIVDVFEAFNNELKLSLQHYVRQLENRSKEFHHPSFVVLVVGPVKSGKSTFVNLVSKNYVSPTHFLECTVRPSIISKNEDEAYLEVYESSNPQNKENQMNDILDFLNGLIEKREIKDVNVHQREFSRENIDKYVKRGLVEVVNDEILLTAIHTEGGKLLQDNVLLVDMAGFDGVNANFDSPAYKAIVKRADLIVFVQSSNSAISKVSSDFFDLLRETNNSVPVCLVHNVFESAYWRAEELKREDIEIQKEYAMDAIRNTYHLALETNCTYNLNLGKVNDFRENKYEIKDKDVLSAEAEEFENAEEKMYELFKKRESIRLKNCITRTKIHKEKLLNEIIVLQEKQDALRENYKTIKDKFENLEKKDISLNFNVSISIDDLKKKVKQEYYTIKETEVTRPKYKTTEARSIVEDFLKNVENEMNNYLHLKQNEVCSTVISDSELQQWLTEVRNVASKYGINEEIKMSCCVKPENITYDIKKSVESKVPKKRFAYKHTADEVNDYLKVFKNLLLGFLVTEREKEKVMVLGYVEKIHAEIQGFINGSIKNARDSIISLVKDEIEKRKLQVLQNEIPDIEVFERNYESLENFKRNVLNLDIHDITL